MSDRPATPESATVTLRARIGRPLSDDLVRRTVVAAARGIAERTGIAVTHLEVEDDALTVTLQTSRVGAIGFAAELRRNTQTWYAARYDGAHLWGADPEEGESWS